MTFTSSPPVWGGFRARAQSHARFRNRRGEEAIETASVGSLARRSLPHQRGPKQRMPIHITRRIHSGGAEKRGRNLVQRGARQLDPRTFSVSACQQESVRSVASTAAVLPSYSQPPNPRRCQLVPGEALVPQDRQVRESIQERSLKLFVRESDLPDHLPPG